MERNVLRQQISYGLPIYAPAVQLCSIVHGRVAPLRPPEVALRHAESWLHVPAIPECPSAKARSVIRRSPYLDLGIDGSVLAQHPLQALKSRGDRPSQCWTVDQSAHIHASLAGRGLRTSWPCRDQENKARKGFKGCTCSPGCAAAGSLFPLPMQDRTSTNLCGNSSRLLGRPR